MTPNEARAAAAAFIASLDPGHVFLWQVEGPKHTAIRYIQAYTLRLTPEGQTRTVLVQIFGDRRGGTTGGGWEILPSVGPNSIEETRAALLRLDALEQGS